MSNTSPANYEIIDYGQPGWSAIVTSNFQKSNDYWNKIWITQTNTDNGKLIKYNSTSGKWEVTAFIDSDVQTAIDDAHTHPNKALLDTYDQTDADLTDAVAKKHTQNTDTQFANGSTQDDVAANTAERHPQQHSITSTTDHTSTATPDQILKADANGLPINATNTDTEVASAVTKANSALQNVVEDTTPQLGGALDAQAHTIYFTLQTYTGVVGTTNIDWTKGNKAKFTFGAGNETLTFTDPAGACGLTLIVVQDSTGGRTLTYPTGIKWAGGVDPTLSTAANAIDVISFYYTGSEYLGMASLDFS